MESRRQQLRRWYRDHRGLLVKVARIYADRPSDREDLIQETLLQLWRALPHFRNESRESTFIYRVALNVALQWRRRRARRPVEEDWSEIPEAMEAGGGDGVERRARVAELYQTIRGLPDVDRALVLLHLEGLSHREIAEVLGLTENHIGVRLHRARRRLAQELEG
jgi:RNA polymerase sigma-70 factor (ECF subfamily)